MKLILYDLQYDTLVLLFEYCELKKKTNENLSCLTEDLNVILYNDDLSSVVGLFYNI